MERRYFVRIFSLTLSLVWGSLKGCDVKQFNSGSTAEQFDFSTTIPAITALGSYKVVYDPANGGPSKLSANFYNGSILGSISKETDVTPKGDVSTGDFSFTLSEVSTAKAGLYEFLKPATNEYTPEGESNVIACVSLYILGKPSTPVLSSGSTPEIGGSLTFTCSSTSTTFPSDHGLSLTYNWSVNSQINPSGSRYTYSDNTLKLSNVQRTDKDKPVSCTTTENLNGGKTSDTSNQLTINVYYGPLNIAFNPTNESYILLSGTVLANIICTAYCNPGCSYVWYKNGVTMRLSSILSLGVLTDTDAATYRCTASRSGYVSEKTLTVDVIYGPSNMSPAAGATYTGNISADLSTIPCSARCWECQYRWTGPVGVVIPGTGPNLTLTNLEKKHDGSYTCTATNTRTGATNITNVFVKVRYGPDTVTLNPSGSSSIVDEGRYLSNIVCNADCYPACTYVWRKKDQASDVATDKTLPLGNNIRRNYTGEYTCTATNPDGFGIPATAVVNIYVRYGPESMAFTPPRTSHTIDEGGDIGTIECKATCHPDCTYVWRKQGQSNPESTNKILTIGNNVQRNKAGRYTCTATNPDRAGRPTATATVYIYVRYGPESMTLTPPQTTRTVDEGGNIGTIECKATCYPDCNFVWRKQDQSNPESSNKNLTIGNNVQRDKAGKYTCTATNPDRAERPTATATVYIYVRYGPDAVSLQPPQQAYTKNELDTLAAINCSTDCYPSCKVKWTRNSQTYDTNILSLDRLEESDAGNYTCMANNPEKAGSASKVVSVNVRYGPKSILFTPPVTSPLTKIEGQYQDPISCSSRCYPSCSASWKKGTQTTSLATGEVLSLGYVNRSYAGNFRCTSTNDATQYDKTTVTDLILVVQYPPDAAITLENGDPRDITLKCLAKGEPSSYTFEQWVHMAPDRSTEIQRYLGGVNGGENILVLKNVTYMDSGVYTCKVSNLITTITTQFGIDNKEINVTDKPFVIQDPREFDAQQHGNVSMSVRFYSYDSIMNITWLKIANGTNSTINNETNKYYTAVNPETVTIPFYTKNVTLQGSRALLNIRDIDDDVGDYTKYEVHIENSIGEVVIPLVVKPRGPPENPMNFSVLQDSETTSSIEFTWFPGFHGGADQTFHIEYKSEGQEWIEGASLFGGKKLNQQLQTKVDGLASGSSYFFRIYASNEYGNSTEGSYELLGNTTKMDPVTPEPTSIIGPAAGGGLGAAVAIVLVIVGVVFLKRRLPKKTKGSSKSNGEKNDRQQLHGNDDLEINLNPMYESAGPVGGAQGDEYAQVMKPKKKVKDTASDENKNLYAEVKKPNKKTDLKKETNADLYAVPDKKTSGSKKQNTVDLYAVPDKKATEKAKKEKKDKKEKKQNLKKTKKDKKQPEMIYENADTLESESKQQENVYENPSCSTADEEARARSPSRMKNDDGLIYVQLELPNQTEKKGAKIYIRGEEDRTDYADIVIGKVGEQMPESDEEEKPKDG